MRRSGVLMGCGCAAMRQVGAAVTAFQEMLLEGVAAPELMQHGLTLEEERAASSSPQVTTHTSAPGILVANHISC
jgi:hypothetical protein